MNAISSADWKLAETLIEPQKMFILWALATGFCQTEADFETHFGKEIPGTKLIRELQEQGFLEEGTLSLTSEGQRAITILAQTEGEEQSTERTTPRKSLSGRRRPEGEKQIRAHILFADNKPSMIEAYTSTLTDEGHAVEVKTSVAETLDFLASCSVDLLIIDINLPMNPFHVTQQRGAQGSIDDAWESIYAGVSLYEQARTLYPGLKIIALSAFSDKEIKAATFTRRIPFNVSAYLRKGDYLHNMAIIRNALK